MPPKFLTEQYQDTIVLKAGTATVLEVPFCGSPQPKVTWTFKDGLIMEERITEETIKNMTALTMKNVVRSDSGNYAVTLENEHGSCTMTIHVLVIGQCIVWRKRFKTISRHVSRPVQTWVKFKVVHFPLQTNLVLHVTWRSPISQSLPSV